MIEQTTRVIFIQFIVMNVYYNVIFYINLVSHIVCLRSTVCISCVLHWHHYVILKGSTSPFFITPSRYNKNITKYICIFIFIYILIFCSKVVFVVFDLFTCKKLRKLTEYFAFFYIITIKISITKRP